MYELRPLAASAATNPSTSSSPIERFTPPLTTLPGPPEGDRKCRLGRNTRQDVSQTEPLPGIDPEPLDPPGEPVTGDSHEHLLAPLEAHAAALGFTVSYESLDGRAGYCSAREARIVVDSALPANGKVATLVHELAHAHGIDYQRFSRPEAELIVESVACIVCAGAGLDTSGESVPYLAGWNPEQAVERIQLLTGTIDETARAIERAIDADDQHRDVTPAASTATHFDESALGRAFDPGQQ